MSHYHVARAEFLREPHGNGVSDVYTRVKYNYLTRSDVYDSCPITMWLPQNFCGIHMVMEFLTCIYDEYLRRSNVMIQFPLLFYMAPLLSMSDCQLLVSYLLPQKICIQPMQPLLFESGPMSQNVFRERSSFLLHCPSSNHLHKQSDSKI